MALGKRKRHAKQASMWVATHDLPRGAAHPFNMRLNQILDKHEFDGYVEDLCLGFCADEDRPGLPPGRYFRLLLRKWTDNPEARDAVYRNRRRIHGARGTRLLRQRGERLERPFAHLYETGRMRRVHLRGHTNILERVLLHTAALNLWLLMRTLFGVGTPRSLQGRVAALLCGLWSLIRLPETLWALIRTTYRSSTSLGDLVVPREHPSAGPSVETAFTTGC